MPGEYPFHPQKGLQELSDTSHNSVEAGPSNFEGNYDDEEDERPYTPPPYSGPTTSSMIAPALPQPQPKYPGLPRLDYSLYSPETFILSQDTTRITSYSPHLSTCPPAHLSSLIKSLATVPPKPIVRLVGTNDPAGLGFDIKLNLMNLIVPEGDEKSRMNYVKIIGPGEKGFRGATKASTTPGLSSLDEWARVYCQDNSSIKQYAYPDTFILTSYTNKDLDSCLNEPSPTGTLPTLKGVSSPSFPRLATVALSLLPSRSRTPVLLFTPPTK
jgi:hypothetical protein